MSASSAFKKRTAVYLKITVLFTLFISFLTSCAKRQDAPPADNDEIYTAVEHAAEFPGGIDEFYAYVTANMRYPETARELKVQGKVYLTFVVEKDGHLSDIKIMRGIGNGCDEEAIRLMKACPKWNPGMQNGVAVREQYTIAITFKL